MKNSVHIFLKNFTTILKHKRAELKYSQAQSSQNIATSLRTYQRIESGNSEPSLSQVYKLAHFLDFKISEIFNFENKLSKETKILLQSSNELEQLSAITNSGGWKIDLTDNTYHWSSNIKKILELDDDFIPSKEAAFSFFKPGENFEIAKTTLSSCIEKHEPFKIQVELVSSKGNIRFVTISGIPEIYQGKIIGVHGAFQDNTKEKLIEEELRKSLKEIADIQSFAGFGYWKMDLLINRLEWSQSLYDLFERDANQEIKSYEDFLDLVEDEDKSIVDDMFKTSLQAKKPYEIEHRIKLPGGKRKWVLERCRIEFNNNGTPVRVLGYALDVSNLKTPIRT